MLKKIALKITLFTVVASCFVKTPVYAETPARASVQNHYLENCKPAYIATPQQFENTSTTSDKASQLANTENAPKTLEADQLTQPQAGQYRMQGQATFTQPGLKLLSDEIIFNQTSETAKFIGQVELHQPNLIITADSAELKNQQRQAQLKNTQFQVLPSRAYGDSKTINIDEQQQTIELKKSSLTTCKMDKNGNKDWDLKFDKLSINNEKRRVVGYGTTLYFKQVPVLYTPYFDYPLDDRATGLLFPEIGSYKSITDNNNLSYLKIPYYFNLSANMDDTLTMIPIQERGLALENEFRYLQKHNNITHGAELTVTAINDQTVAKNGLSKLDENGDVSFTDSDPERWRLKLNAQQIWGNGFSSLIDWQTVSDATFYREIPVERALKNENLKKRTVRLNYEQDNFNAYAEVFSYLRLENAQDNYEKRPEIGFNYRQQYGQFGVDLTTTFTDFYVPNTNTVLTEGKRLHIVPAIQYQIQNSYAFLKSTLLANFTQYQFADNANVDQDKNVSRSIPQFALNTGLLFERPTTVFGQRFTQTLEPQIQYLFTPYRHQENITLFDTTDQSLAFSNLFALNRFTGADRIADSNQTSIALTSRLLNKNGQEQAKASIGQIIYFAEREVGLENDVIDDSKISDLFLDFAIKNYGWSFASTLQLDQENYQVNNANSRLKWQDEKHNNALFLLNYALFNAQSADPIDTLSLGTFAKITPEWQLGLFHSANLNGDDYTLSQIGLSYRSCCWSTEIIAERTQLENGLYNNGIQIQFELNGLSTTNSGFKNNLTDKLDF